MGLIGNILGLGSSADKIGGAVERVAEVFVPNRTKKAENQYRRERDALDQFGAEFGHAASAPFDRFVNALNRLPRPVLALGTVGLFAYAMTDPTGFSIRMQGLNTVPDPLWWLLGAIVSFYFGARELHYQRRKHKVAIHQPQSLFTALPSTRNENAALNEWRELNK
jgi:hypothetical protein